MMRRISFALISVFTLLSGGVIFAESDFNYALFLFKRGSYSASILELERFIYYNPQDFFIPHAKLIAALSYAHDSQYESALSLLRGIPYTVEESPYEESYDNLLCEANFHTLNILFRQRRVAEFQLQKENVLALCPQMDKSLLAHIDSMSVAFRIYEMDWPEALEKVSGPSHLPHDVAALLKTELEEVIEHKDRSPVIGGVLSLIPGFGHIYAGRVVDGFKSLLINTAFISLTVFSFEQDMTALGTVFGVVEGVLYISNIYGGVNAVLQENARYAIERRDRMLKALPSPPLDIISIREEFEIQ